MRVRKSVAAAAKSLPNPYVLALLLSLTHPALATTYTWTGTTGTDYNITTNWSPLGPPLAADTAILDVGASNTTPTITGVSDTLNTLTTNTPGYTLSINSGGQLTLNGTGINGPSPLGITVNSGNLLLTGSATASNANIALTSTTADLAVSSSATLGSATVVSSSNSINFSGNASAGSANITQNGTLSNNFDFVNNSTAANSSITMNSGTLLFSGSSTGGTSTITLNNNAQLDFSSTGDFSNTTVIGTGTGGITLLANASVGALSTTGSVSEGTSALTVGNLNQNGTISGLLSGLTFTKIGTGKLILSNIGNSVSTLVTVSGGTLDMASIQSPANVGASGTLEFIGSVGLGAHALTNAGIVNFLNGSSAGSSPIANTGTVNVNNSSTLGSSVTTNNSGAIVNFNSTGTSIGATVNNNAGGTVNALANINIGELSGAGNVTIATGATLTLGNINVPVTISGNITGGGGLTKTGANSLTLSGTNGYTGLTTATAGSLLMGSIGGNASVGVSGILEFINSANLGANTAINSGVLDFFNASSAGTGTVTNNAAATLNFNTTGDNSSATVANAGTLNLLQNTSIGALSGAGAIALGSNTLTVGNLNQTSTVSGTISSGAGGAFTKIGTGVQTLSGTNSYTGLTTVTGGTLDMATISGAATVGASGILEFINTANLGANGVTNAGTLNFLGSSNAGSSSVVNNTGIVNVNAASTLGTSTLTNNGGTINFNSSGSAANATVTNNPGTVNILANTSIGTLTGSGNVTITPSSTTLTLGNLNVPTTIAGNITGSGNLTKIGTAGLTLNGANGYTGLTTVSNGTLIMGSISGNANVGASGMLALNGATIVGGITITNAGNLILEAATNTANSAITNTGTINVENSTTLGTSTITNNSPGVVAFDSTGDSSSATVVNNTGGVVSIFRNTSIGALSGAGNVLLSNNTLTLGNLNQTNTITGTISGTGGGITKVGTGLQTLSGTNSYTGLTTVTSGTLDMGSIAGAATVGASGILEFISSANLGANGVTNSGVLNFFNASTAGSSTITNNVGGIVNFNSTGSAANADVNNAGTVNLLANTSIGALSGAGNIGLGSNTLTIGNLNIGDTVSGNISGTGGALTKIGTGQQILSGSNTYTGLTTVSAGILSMASIAGNATVGASGTLDFSASTIGSSTVTNAGVLNFLGSSNGGNAAITNTGTTSVGITSTLGSATLTNNSGGIANFSSTASSAGAKVINTAGATVNIVANTNIGSLSGAGSVSLAGGTTLTAGALGNTDTITGTITGTGAFTKVGTGTQTLSGANNYTGLTTVSAGTLDMGSISGNANVGASGTLEFTGATNIGGIAVTNAGILNFLNSSSAGTSNITNTGIVNLNAISTLGSATLTNNSGGTANFDSAGTAASGTVINNLGGNVNLLANTSIGTLSGAGNISLGGNTLTIVSLNGGTVFGNITGTGGVTKIGANTQILSGANNYTGVTDVAAGTLDMGSISGIATVASGATLEFINAATDNHEITNNGGIVNFLNNSNAGISPIINNSGGVLSFLNNSSTGSSNIINNLGATIDFNSTGSAANGVVDNIGSVNILANTSIGSITGAGSISLGANNLTLGNLSTIDTISGTITGTGGSITKIGTSTTSLNGTNSYTGLTKVSNGTLSMASISGSADVQIAGTLDLTGSATLGSVNVVNNGVMNFQNNASAGNATIFNNTPSTFGILNFLNNSTAGNSTINNNGEAIINFNSTGSAAGSTINNTWMVNILQNTSIGAISGIGDIVLGSNTLTVGALGQNSTVYGDIIGTGGALTKIGAGQQILSGDNAYTGLTTVSAGTLDMASISGNAIVAPGATLEFINSANISGISIINSGILNFLNNSTDAGATITNNLGSTLTFNSTGDFSNTTIGNSGTIDLLVDTSIGSLSGSGNTSIGSSTLTLGNLNLNDTVTGSVTGTTGGITKIGTGNQSLLGVNSYSGLTTVSSGTLTMAGTFTGSALVSNGATLALTNYTPGPGTSLRLGLTPTSNGVVDVAGSAAVGNAGLELDIAAGVYNPAMTYTLVQGGAVSGTFMHPIVVPPLLLPHVVYTPSSVLLNLEPLTMTSVITGMTASEKSLASNLDLIFSLPGLSPEWLQIQGLLTVSTEAEIITALDAMSPQRFTGVTTVIDTNMKQITKSLAARGRSFIDHAKGRSVAANTGGFNTMPKFTNSGSAVSALAQRATTGKKEAFIDSILASPEVHFDNMQRLSVADQMHMTENRGSPWVQPFGNVSSLESNSKTSMTGYDVKTGGIMVGFDETINENFFTGIAGGYSYTDLKFKQHGGDSHIGNAFMSLYATFAGGPWHVDGSISGGLLHFKENRNIIFNIINSTAHNSHNGYVISPHVGVGYEFTVMDAQVEPFINLDYDYNKNKGYTETGANSLNLVMNSRNSSQLLSEFGVLASKTYNECYGTFQPSLSLSFVNVKPTKKDNMLSSFVGEPGNFISVGINKNLNYGSATASATFNYNSGSRLSFAYTANVNNRYNSQQASVVYGIRL